MKHFSFCIDRIDLAYTLGAAAQAVRECSAGEVVELNFCDLALHFVVIDDSVESEDDEE